jgi:putative DNA primase/helicase
VWRYLAGRGIIIPVPASLRWVSRCWHGAARACLPAMVAAIVDVAGELIGVHRTFLRPDGTGKAEVEPCKAMLGRAAGGAVRLAPAAETLMVGEGIETCLAAMQACAMPAWAALGTSGLTGLILPPNVHTVIVLADNDTNGTGERAARAAAARWLAEGRRVRIAIPPMPGTDMADVLAGSDARIMELGDAAA